MGACLLCPQYFNPCLVSEYSTLFFLFAKTYTLYTFCSILQQQLNTRKKEIRISHLLLQRKNSVDKGCTLNVPTRFLHCFCFLYSPLLNFLKHLFANVEEKKELLTTHEWIWMTKYGQSVSLWAYQVDTSVVHACGPTAGSIRSLSGTKTGGTGGTRQKTPKNGPNWGNLVATGGHTTWLALVANPSQIDKVIAIYSRKMLQNRGHSGALWQEAHGTDLIEVKSNTLVCKSKPFLQWTVTV